jgi:hypothetical protein
MAKVLRDTLPRVKVTAISRNLWRPDEIERLVTRNDLIIDATGNQAYRDLLSRLAAAGGKPMVAAALHRRGDIARVHVQIGVDAPIWARGPATGFEVIQRDPGAPPILSFETGCGSPVNNAPPVAVMSAAAAASRVAIDVLAGRERREVDIVDVFAPIEQPAFNKIGQLVFEATP